MCETDFSGYPDCRDETVTAMAAALTLGLGQGVTIETPLMWLTKAETWALAHTLGGEPLVDLIVRETVTCYRGERAGDHPSGGGCGTCPSCLLRRKGWESWKSAKP